MAVIHVYFEISLQGAPHFWQGAGGGRPDLAPIARSATDGGYALQKS